MLRDIVNKNREQLVLLENKKQYMQMFQFVDDYERAVNNMALPGGINQVRQMQDKRTILINWARNHLKRNDRIVWFLRYARIGLLSGAIDVLQNMGEGAPETMIGLLEPVLKKSISKLASVVGGTPQSVEIDASYVLSNDFTEWAQHLSAMYSLIPELDRVVWGNEDRDTLMSVLNGIEEEWKQEIDELALDPHDGDEEIFSFGDYSWWLLDRGACDEEATAMGHCGNAPSERSGDRILSLRKKVRRSTDEDDVGWVPHLTFIINDGWLGEMKGRGNEKPAERYHPYIVKLLMSPYVEGIVGGGYMPQNNFDMNDLPVNQRQTLLKKKPTLAGVWEVYRRDGFVPVVQKYVMNRLGNFFNPEVIDYPNRAGEKLIVIEEHPDAASFYEDADISWLNELITIWDAIEDEDYEELSDLGLFPRLEEDDFDFIIRRLPTDTRDHVIRQFSSDLDSIGYDMRRVQDSMDDLEFFVTKGHATGPERFIQYIYTYTASKLPDPISSLPKEDICERIFEYYSNIYFSWGDLSALFENEKDPHTSVRLVLTVREAINASEEVGTDDDYYMHEFAHERSFPEDFSSILDNLEHDGLIEKSGRKEKSGWRNRMIDVMEDPFLRELKTKTTKLSEVDLASVSRALDDAIRYKEAPITRGS